MAKEDGKGRFTRRDYFSLGGAVILACAIWLIHTLSLTYSDVIRSNVVIKCDKDGLENISQNLIEVAVRCEMDGYSLLSAKHGGDGSPTLVSIEEEDIHLYAESDLGSTFYMTSQDLQKYSHIIFGSGCKVDYFLADTFYIFFNRAEYVKLPVIPVTDFEFKSQYMPDEPLKITPDTVLVYGDVNKLKNLESISTRPVYLRGIDSDIIGTVSLQDVGGVRLSATKVDYFQSVVRYVEFEERVPVVMLNVPDGVNVRIYPSHAVVKVKNYYPIPVEPGSLKVVIDWQDFVNSRSGCCVARLSDRPISMISYEMSPDVFECIQM